MSPASKLRRKAVMQLLVVKMQIVETAMEALNVSALLVLQEILISQQVSDNLVHV